MLLENFSHFATGGAVEADVKQTLEASERALCDKNHQYFKKALGLAEAWRAFESFRDSLVYLDIETDGGQGGESVTIVGIYDGSTYHVFQKNENLADFPDFMSHYGMVVTFFGSGFDLPVLQRKFWNLTFDQVHLDLCPTLKRLGYRGGLKKIEKQVGIARGDETEGLSGLDAVYMWRAFLTGDKQALDRLIAYNREDVVNLERLAELAVAKMTETTWGAAQKSVV